MTFLYFSAGIVIGVFSTVLIMSLCVAAKGGDSVHGRD